MSGAKTKALSWKKQQLVFSFPVISIILYGKFQASSNELLYDAADN